MFKLFLLLSVLVYGTRVYSTPLKLSPEIELMISSKLEEGLRKGDAPKMLEDVLLDVQGTNGPVALDPLTGQPYYSLDFTNKPSKKQITQFRPDELKGCVTKTRTVCVGKGADRECTTDSWEVCVSSD